MATFRTALIAGAAFSMLSAGAMAAPFGPASASLGSFDVPTVTIGALTSTIQLNGGLAQLSAGTGNFAGSVFGGSGSGTLNFSNIPNIITSDVIAGLFSFSDNHGGQYVYNLSSIDTVSFSNAPGVSSSIGLYLSGTMSEVNANPSFQLDATATSLTMTFNSTGNSSYSESGSLSNPPAPIPTAPPSDVPEPASLALLGAGLAGLGLTRRRRAQ